MTEVVNDLTYVYVGVAPRPPIARGSRYWEHLFTASRGGELNDVDIGGLRACMEGVGDEASSE